MIYIVYGFDASECIHLQGHNCLMFLLWQSADSSF